MPFDIDSCATNISRQLPPRFVSSAFRGGRAAARWQAVLGALGPVAVALLLPDAHAEIALLNDARPDVVLGAVAVLATTLVAWALVAWAAVVGCAAAASRLPGAAGRLGRRTLVAVTPSALRRIVIAAAGLSIAAGLGACGHAGATPGAVVSPAASVAGAAAPTGAPPEASAAARGDVLVDLDWPSASALGPVARSTPAASDKGVDPTPVVPPTDARPPMTQPSDNSVSGRPVTTRTDPPDDAVPAAPIEAEPGAGRGADHVSADEPTERAGSKRAASAPVVVHRGDTLWAIAAAHLPDGAPAAQIDAAWREWYAANRAVIGADPNLVIPGQQLSPPPRWRTERRSTGGTPAGMDAAPETTFRAAGGPR